MDCASLRQYQRSLRDSMFTTPPRVIPASSERRISRVRCSPRCAEFYALKASLHNSLYHVHWHKVRLKIVLHTSVWWQVLYDQKVQVGLAALQDPGSHESCRSLRHAALVSALPRFIGRVLQGLAESWPCATPAKVLEVEERQSGQTGKMAGLMQVRRRYSAWGKRKSFPEHRERAINVCVRLVFTG